MKKQPGKRWWIVGFTRAISVASTMKAISISWADRKNVYPDEVEEVYQESPYIKELSVVGLPDGIGEKVACLVHPDYEHDIALSRAEVRTAIEEHFREVSGRIPYYKRVKLLHFTEEDLPRTATRKVKRRDVIRMLQEIEDQTRSAATVA